MLDVELACVCKDAAGLVDLTADKKSLINCANSVVFMFVVFDIIIPIVLEEVYVAVMQFAPFLHFKKTLLFSTSGYALSKSVIVALQYFPDCKRR